MSFFRRRLFSAIGNVLFRDKVIIPDLYNSGCNEDLDDFSIATMSHGLTWKTESGTVWRLDFNIPYTSVVDNLSDGDTVVFENINFIARSFQIWNATNYTSNKQGYRANLTFVFKNCLFGVAEANRDFPSQNSIKFVFENCTLGYVALPNSEFRNCIIGHHAWMYEKYGKSKAGGEGTNPFNWCTYKDCYFMDLVGPTSTQGTAHIDALQTHNAVQGLVLDNCRFEAMDIKFPATTGDFAHCVYWEQGNQYSKIKNCIIHGGGYYQTNIVKASNQELEGNLISGVYSDFCYPSGSGVTRWQMSDGWADIISTLLVGSVWVDDGNINICVSNDLHEDRTLRVVDNLGNEYTFTIPLCPTRSELNGGTSGVTAWADLPFDLVKEINASGVSSIQIYDDETLIRTFEVSE